MAQHDELDDSPEFWRSWWNLGELCTHVNDLLYLQDDPTGASERLQDLERFLTELPMNRKAVVYWDALALVAALKGQFGEAAEYRRREIELMLELHRLVEDGTDSPSVLVGRDMACLEWRRRIHRALLQE